MNTFLETIRQTEVAAGSVAVFWAAQAGFIFKLPDGLLVAADLYLSDCCERYFGFKRLMPRPFLPGEATFDLLLSTHAHYDHFDVDSMPWLLASGQTELVCARDCQSEIDRLHLAGERIHYLGKGEQLTIKGIDIRAVDCDHGELAPDAVGLVLTLAGKRVYIMGDTAYRPDWLDKPVFQQLDLLILPVNGAYGNLNEEQAAQVVAQLRPKRAVPCHYGLFEVHGGDVRLFTRAMDRLAPSVPYLVPAVGEPFFLR